MKPGGNKERPPETKYPKEHHEVAKIYTLKIWQFVKAAYHKFWFKELAPEARFAGWVARLTLVLCIIGAVQTWAFLESERANLTIQNSGPFDFPQKPGVALVVSMAIQNAGKSTARVVENTTNFWLNDSPLPEKPIYTSCNCAIPLAIVGGNAIHTIFWPRSGDSRITLTPDQYARIKGGTLPIYIYGFITYRDAFSFLLGSRTLGFCMVYEPTNDATTGAFNSCSNLRYSYSN